VSKLKIRTVFAWLLIVLGILGLGLSQLKRSHEAKPPSDTARSVSVEPAPSSDKPSPAAVAAYIVPPTLPKYITIPAINVRQAKVVGLGYLKNGQIATPGNIYETGWYNRSSKPGQAGAMFIYGHVSNWQANGIFYDLQKLKAGDTVTVTRGDDKVFTYQVVQTKVYPADSLDMPQVLAPADSDTPGLNLMTCTGKVIKGTSDFDQRLVVFTKQVGS
jgi:LPXTG-site transpeptidase (sortase) family protein